MSVTNDSPESVLDKHVGSSWIESFPTSGLDNYKLLKAKTSSSHHKILNLNEVKYTVASSWDTDNN